MSVPGGDDPSVMARHERFVATVAGCGLAVLLAVAGWLKPDPRHNGTHEQLGLPPCTFTVLFGRRCPTCGATTAWSHLVRGQFSGALAANATGTLAGAMAIVAVPWLLASAARGRWYVRSMKGDWATWVVAGLFAMAVIEWCVRLLIS